MRFLVTGINGTVGGNVFRQLLKHPDYEIWGISKNKYRYSDNLPDHARNRTFALDMRSELPEVLSAGYFDVVIHAAAITPKNINRGNPYDDNVLLAKTLCRYLNNTKTQLFFLSTGSVYAESSFICKENSALTLTNEYGLSMGATEHIFREKLKNVTILRLFYPYAFDAFTLDNNLITKLLLRIKNEETITTNSCYKESLINPIFFNDIIAIIQQLISKDVKNETINIGNPSPCTFFELLNVLSKKAGGKTVEIFNNDKIESPLCADISKLSTYINITSLTSFTEGVNYIE